jgi:hypothetical protein
LGKQSAEVYITQRKNLLEQKLKESGEEARYLNRDQSDWRIT